jgi:hypothetical protein
VKLYFEKYLNTDGHASLSPTSNIILTDTYPDRYGELSIILFNYEKERKHIILKAYQNILNNYDEKRCDLHPQWNS